MPRPTSTCDLCGEQILLGQPLLVRKVGTVFHVHCPANANTRDTKPGSPSFQRAAYQNIMGAAMQEEAMGAPHGKHHWRAFQLGAHALATALGILKDEESERELAEWIKRL